MCLPRPGLRKVIIFSGECLDAMNGGKVFFHSFITDCYFFSPEIFILFFRASPSHRETSSHLSKRILPRRRDVRTRRAKSQTGRFHICFRCQSHHYFLAGKSKTPGHIINSFCKFNKWNFYFVFFLLTTPRRFRSESRSESRASAAPPPGSPSVNVENR